MMVRADLFKSLGGFDRNIFLFYEDDDLCRRVVEAGSSIIYIHQSIVLHLRGQSSTPSLRTIYVMRACQAWSRGYISAKHGLVYRPVPTAVIYGLKLIFATLTLNRSRIARYGGTFSARCKPYFIVLAQASLRVLPSFEMGGLTKMHRCSCLGMRLTHKL